MGYFRATMAKCKERSTSPSAYYRGQKATRSKEFLDCPFQAWKWLWYLINHQGYPNVTIGKSYEYQSDPYDRRAQLEKVSVN